MSFDARVSKLPVLLISMALLFTAIEALALIDFRAEIGSSSSEELIKEGTSNEIPNDRGTRSPAVTFRSVLVELFTGTWCMYCPGAEGALDRLAEENPQTMLSILEYHIGDSYEVTGNSGRRAYYGNPAYPAAFFDGVDSYVGGSENPDDPGVYNEYQTRIGMRMGVLSPFTITLTGSLGSTTGSITANITAIDDLPPALNLKARFVVYEDHNYSVMSGGREYRLRYTVVENLPEESFTITKEQTLGFTKTFSLDPSWDLNKLGVCVFIQDDDKIEVYQATSLNLSALSSKVDLAITPLDISFSDPTPSESQIVTIYANVHNVGTLTTPSNVYVSFFDGDPFMGGTQIGTDQDAGIITAGGSAMVQVDWDTTGQVGYNEIVVEADPMMNIWEPENEHNNKAPKSIDVASPPQLDYIQIRNAPGGGGSWVGDSLYRFEDTDTFLAGGYNDTVGWFQDVPATWSSDAPSIGDVSPGPSISTTFNTFGFGTCNVTADYSSFSNTTGVLTVASHSILKQGWNLISLPLIQSDPSLSKVLESISGDYNAVQLYDITDTNDPWKHNKIGKTYGNDLSNIDETMAFWLCVNQPGDTIFLHNGEPATMNHTIDLYPGWNLVGYPSLTSYDRTVGLNNLTFGDQVDAIWSYDAATQKCEEMEGSDYFQIGKGYYIHANTKCEWEVPL